VSACSQALELSPAGELPRPQPFASIQPDRPVVVRARRRMS
jgi:hypothetical protein